MFGYGKKIVIVEDKKEGRSVVVVVGDEKREEQLLMGSTKIEQQLFGMNKGKSSCCWGSIKLLKHIF
jgi:hypothetical protein